MKKVSRRGFLGMAAASLGVAATSGCTGDGLGDGGAGCSDASGPPDSGDAGAGGGCTAAQDLPVMAETDVLVVGGGPAGIAAAIAAARAGAKTMLVERYGFFGGVITQSIMGSITWYRYAKTVDAGGVCAEIEAKAHAMGGSINLLEVIQDPAINALLRALAEDAGLVKGGKPTYEILRTELFKAVADAMIVEEGITPLLHTMVVGVLMDASSIRGVITESKSGRQVILAKRVVDASGDADVAFHAGAPFSKSPREELMEVTTNFSCGNVDLSAFLAYVWQQNKTMADWIDDDCGKEKGMFSSHVFQAFKDAADAGEIPKDVVIKAFPGGFTGGGSVLSLNAVHLYGAVDPTDVWDLTWAEMEGRRRVLMAMDVLRKRVPGFEKAELSMIAPSLGCRESRKILGGYLLTGQEVRSEARFDDSIGVFPEFVDGYGILCLPTTGRYYQVPYRITVPQGVENLLVAGRCVAGDRHSHASTRQMACCMVTGQGAGVAAAVSLQDGTTCRDVDIAKVQSTLTSQGVRIA